MRVLAVAALCLGLLGGGAAANGEGAIAKPRLRAASLIPLVLEGRQFVPGERIVLTVDTLDSESKRNVRASRTGTFLIRFPEIAVDRCNGLLAFARGSRGSRAGFKLPPGVFCPPQLRAGA